MPKTIKYGTNVINLDEYADVDTHCIVLYASNIEIKYLNKIKTFNVNKNITTNIFRIQANNSIMCGYFCIGLINFMLAGKNLIDYTSLFSPYDFKLIMI